MICPGCPKNTLRKSGASRGVKSGPPTPLLALAPDGLKVGGKVGGTVPTPDFRGVLPSLR